MKKLAFTLAIFVILLKVSFIHCSFNFFRPSAYIFSEAEISNGSSTTKRPPHSRERSNIRFPTPVTYIEINSTANWLWPWSTTARPATKPSSPLPSRIISNRTDNSQENLGNTTLPTTNRIQDGDNPLNHTSSNETVPTCRPESDSASKARKSFLTDNYIRTKLCSGIPPQNLSREFRFDLDAKVCSPVGKQSHCGKNMIFYSFARNTVYGHCDCDYSSRIPLLYHDETSRCYFMYQQGFCKQNEWIEMEKESGKAICLENKCYSTGRPPKFGSPPLASRDIAPEYVPLKGNGPCVKLDHPNQQHCKGKGGNFVAFRWPLEFYPNCGEPPSPPLPAATIQPGSNATMVIISPRFLGEVASLECNHGSYLNAMGGCQPDWEFD